MLANAASSRVPEPEANRQVFCTKFPSFDNTVDGGGMKLLN
jgi:hypothetical protein